MDFGRNFKSHFFLLTLILTLILTFTACKPAQRSVRIAIQPSAAFIPLYIARYTNAIENALKKKNVTLVWQDFESGPPMNEFLSAEMTDIGVIGDVPTVLALAGTTKMKLVGIPARGPDAYAMIARADDSSFNSFEDMKGKKIATVFGSTGHNFIEKLLGKAGLSFEDIEFINISASEAEVALSEGFADAVIIWEPNITRIIDRGIAKIVAQGHETDLRGTNGFVVREDYLKENADIIKEILLQYERAAKSLSNLDAEILHKLSLALNVTEAQIKSIMKKYDYSVNVTKEDQKALQDTISFLVSINNLKYEYWVESYIEKDLLK